MKYWRSFLATICFGIFGIGSIILNFLLFPFVKNNKILCSDIIRCLWKIFIKLLNFLKLIKIDIVILMSLIPKSTCFVKKELANNPILKNIISSIFIPNDIEIETLKEKSKTILDKGFNLIIFPMGIRHRKNEYPKIKKGAALIASYCEKDIVPIKIYTDEDFLFIHQPFYAVGKKIVTFQIEMCNEIKIKNFNYNSEIITKKEITKQIEKLLYGL